MVLCLCAMHVAAWAAQYTPSSVPNPKDAGQACYVANPDAILSDSDVVFLNRCASMLESQTEVELCVVALESIGETDCYDFTFELFQRWGIGKEGKNTGVLICFVLTSRDIRIMTGVGLEGILPDARCSQIIREQMVPAFRNGAYGEGLCLGALRIYEICTDGEAPEELRNMQSVTNRGEYAEQDGLSDETWTILIAFAIFIVLIIWASVRYRQKGGSHHRHDDDFGGGTFFPTGGGGSMDGGFSGGSWGGGSTFGGGAGGKW